MPGRGLSADVDEPGTAFLDEAALLFRGAAGVEPGRGRTEGGVAGEGQLPVRSEDPQAVVGGGIGGGEDEGGLGQVRPVRDPGHLFVVEAIGVEDDGDGIAAEGNGGEDVDLGESS
jgi:hypothetical protein